MTRFMNSIIWQLIRSVPYRTFLLGIVGLISINFVTSNIARASQSDQKTSVIIDYTATRGFRDDYQKYYVDGDKFYICVAFEHKRKDMTIIDSGLLDPENDQILLLESELKTDPYHLGCRSHANVPSVLQSVQPFGDRKSLVGHIIKQNPDKKTQTKCSGNTYYDLPQADTFYSCQFEGSPFSYLFNWYLLIDAKGKETEFALLTKLSKPAYLPSLNRVGKLKKTRTQVRLFSQNHIYHYATLKNNDQLFSLDNGQRGAERIIKIHGELPDHAWRLPNSNLIYIPARILVKVMMTIKDPALADRELARLIQRELGDK